LAQDVSVIDQVFDELARGLLGDPEMLGHVRSGGIAITDPRKRKTMRWANVIKATASETLLYPIYELAGQAQYGNGRLPTLAVHVEHLDMS
jgi:hypothetical protein